MRGIPFMFLLKERAGLSLKQAQKMKTDVLDNIEVMLVIDDAATAHEIVLEAEKLGVNSFIIDG